MCNVKTSNGKYLVDGKKIAGFSNQEEKVLGSVLGIENYIQNVLPFELETKLKERGGVYSSASPWQSHVQVDSRVVTGQNRNFPFLVSIVFLFLTLSFALFLAASATDVANEIVKLLGL